MNKLTKFFQADNSEFFALFGQSGDNLLHGAELLGKLLDVPDSKRAGLFKEIVACEHDGDEITSKINRRLDRTFVTPFDREDIYALATRLDDTLDFIEEAADYVSLYQLETIRPAAKNQAELVFLACQQLVPALTKLNGFQDISQYTDEIYNLERQGDRVVRDAIAELFKSEKDAKTLLAWKDMFERLEDALDAAKHVSSALKGITIRNS